MFSGEAAVSELNKGQKTGSGSSLSAQQPGLLPDKMLRIIAAAEIPLPGWHLPLPDDWFDNPRRAVQVGQKRPLDVLRRFRELLEKANSNFLRISQGRQYRNHSFGS